MSLCVVSLYEFVQVWTVTTTSLLAWTAMARVTSPRDVSSGLVPTPWSLVNSPHPRTIYARFSTNYKFTSPVSTNASSSIAKASLPPVPSVLVPSRLVIFPNVVWPSSTASPLPCTALIANAKSCLSVLTRELPLAIFRKTRLSVASRPTAQLSCPATCTSAKCSRKRRLNRPAVKTTSMSLTSLTTPLMLKAKNFGLLAAMWPNQQQLCAAADGLDTTLSTVATLPCSVASTWAMASRIVTSSSWCDDETQKWMTLLLRVCKVNYTYKYTEWPRLMRKGRHEEKK